MIKGSVLSQAVSETTPVESLQIRVRRLEVDARVTLSDILLQQPFGIIQSLKPNISIQKFEKLTLEIKKCKPKITM